ncbi:uncharacterized protein LOC144163768 [Haemaphysalis longicornis]
MSSSSPPSSLILLLLIVKLSIQPTEQASPDFKSFVRTPWTKNASDDMCPGRKDFPASRPSPCYQPEASRARQARHRLLRGRPPSPDADRASPRPPPSIGAASFPRTHLKPVAGQPSWPGGDWRPGGDDGEVTKATQQNDPFLNWPVSPTAVIKLHEVLNHGLDCADGLRLLKPTSDKSDAFFRYFQDDTTPAAALAPHKTKLARQEDGESLLASSAVNPPVSTVYHWFCGWRRGQYGDEGVSPLTKLDRRAPNHVEHSCLEGAFRKLDWESKHRTTPKKPAPAHPQGKANRWQQSLNSSSCLWIPSHSWRPRAQLEAVTNDTAELQKIYEEWWRQPSLAAGNPYYATALQQLLRQMHKIRKEPQEGACP